MAFHEFIFATFNVPTSVAGAAWLVVQSLAVFLVVMLADRFIAHGYNIKHTLMLAFGAYFLSPAVILALQYAGISITNALFIVPLVVWVVLGELLLEGDRKNKLIVAVVGYLSFVALNESPLKAYVIAMF